MIRIIPRLDIKNSNVINTVNFEGLRKVGCPNSLALKYYNDGADELILYDLVASLYGRNTLNEFIDELLNEVFIPITVCGGIRSLQDAISLLRNGADKVGINSAAVRNPSLINEISDVVGKQSLVISIETRILDGKRRVLIDGGRELTSLDLYEWVKEVQDRGAGEIHLLSIDNEGRSKGYDIDLLNQLSNFVEIPLIVSGGFNGPNNIHECINLGFDAFAIAGQLHTNKVTIKDLKSDLMKKHMVKK